MPRWMLEQSAELVSSSLGRLLLGFTQQSPVDKPEGHKGSRVTDMFKLALDPETARQILSQIELAQRTGRTTSATRARGLGGFCQAWQELADSLG